MAISLNRRRCGNGAVSPFRAPHAPTQRGGYSGVIGLRDDRASRSMLNDTRHRRLLPNANALPGSEVEFLAWLSIVSLIPTIEIAHRLRPLASGRVLVGHDLLA